MLHSECGCIPQQVAHAIAKVLSEFGMPAFIVEPPEDTAIRLWLS